MALLDELETAYMDAAAGDARDALRRALADALAEIEAVSAQVSRGFVRRPVFVQQPSARSAEPPPQRRVAG